MSKVRRWAHTVTWEGLQISAAYMAINDRGEYVMHDDYAALEAELAKLRAGQEPDGSRLDADDVRSACQNAIEVFAEEENAEQCREVAEYMREVLLAALYRAAQQPSAVPDGWRLVPVEPTPEMVSAAEEAHMAFGDMDIALRMAILSAHSAPATVQGVNQQLLEALENTATWIEKLPVPTVGAAGQLVKIDKAIAAARKGEGK